MISRRNLIGSAGAAMTLAACGNGVGGNGGAMIDARVDQTRNQLFQQYPRLHLPHRL